MVKITLVDDTDLSIVGTGQQAYTYGLFSKVANFAEVVLITQSLRDPSRLSWASEIKVVKCLPGRLGVNLCSHTALSEIISSAKDSDVMIAEHIYGINRWAPLASRLLRIPFIYHSHGNEIETSNTVKQKLSIFPIEKYMYESSNFIIAISETTIINAIKTYKLRGKRYAVLPPGLREVLCADNQAFRVLNDYEHVKLFKELILEYYPRFVDKSLNDFLKVLGKDYKCDIRSNEDLGIMHCVRK